MLKTLISQIKQYKSNTIKTPIYVAIEVIMEVLIPYLMAILVDQGIENGDMKVLWFYGFIMLIAAIISLSIKTFKTSLLLILINIQQAA